MSIETKFISGIFSEVLLIGGRNSVAGNVLQRPIIFLITVHLASNGETSFNGHPILAEVAVVVSDVLSSVLAEVLG